jgi:hypothetical protein
MAVWMSSSDGSSVNVPASSSFSIRRRPRSMAASCVRVISFAAASPRAWATLPAMSYGYSS